MSVRRKPQMQLHLEFRDRFQLEVSTPSLTGFSIHRQSRTIELDFKSERQINTALIP